MKVFLSYSHRDEQSAELIRTRLEQEGITVGPPPSLRLGSSLILQIQNEIESADAVLFLVSKDSAESEFVRREISAALASSATSDSSKRIIPVLLERRVDLPFFLGRYVAADLSDPDRRQATLDEIVDTLKDMAGAESKESPRSDLEKERQVLLEEEKLLRLERAHHNQVYRERDRRFLHFLSIFFSILAVAPVFLAGLISDVKAALLFLGLALVLAAITSYGVGLLSERTRSRRSHDD